MIFLFYLLFQKFCDPPSPQTNHRKENQILNNIHSIHKRTYSVFLIFDCIKRDLIICDIIYKSQDGEL